jgi:hypothetical protein
LRYSASSRRAPTDRRQLVELAHIELTSDEIASAPRFKLVCDIKSADEIEIDFSIAMPGAAEFKHFTGGTVHRVGTEDAK